MTDPEYCDMELTNRNQNYSNWQLMTGQASHPDGVALLRQMLMPD